MDPCYFICMSESEWNSFGCQGSTRRWRWLSDGTVEIEGQGVPRIQWPKKVNEWGELISKSSLAHGVSPFLTASIMALETGGVPACLGKDGRVCTSGITCDCNTREGIGLMAMLTSTASSVAGRQVTARELLSDHPLAIDLGAKYISMLQSRLKTDDPIKIGVGYNAGGIRCGRGKVFGGTEQCPETGWGIVIGCVYSSRNTGGCSQAEDGRFVCSNMYPAKVAGLYNSSLSSFTGGEVPPLPPVPPTPPPPPSPPTKAKNQEMTVAHAGVFLASALAAYFMVRTLRPS